MYERTNKFLIGISIFIVTNVSQLSHAQYLTGPVASGFGGAGRAGVEDGEQFLLNPAAVVHSAKASSALMFMDGALASREHDRILGLTLSDNGDELLFSGAYGFFDRRRTFAGLPTFEEQHHNFALAGWVLKHLSVGVSATYTKSDMDGGAKASAYLAANPATDASGKYSQIDGNIGIHYNPNPNFGVGLVYYNLAPTKDEIPLPIRNLDKLGLGTHFIFREFFRFRLDVAQQTELNSEGKIEVNGGFETKVSSFWLVRGGYANDGLADRQFYILGLGFAGPRLKIDYFYRKNPDYSDGAMHGVDMRLPFW